VLEDNAPESDAFAEFLRVLSTPGRGAGDDPHVPGFDDFVPPLR
jgi:hypothetical protein